MTCWRGTIVVPGAAHGPLWSPQRAAGAATGGGTIQAFDEARRIVADDLRALPEDLRTMYEALLFDTSWDEGVAGRTRAGETLERAISETAAQNAQALATLEDPYLRARAHDFEQLGAQLLRTMQGVQDPPSGAIVAASDVSALELQRWSRDIAGLVLLGISPMAHLAILARGSGLPTIALAERSLENGEAGAIALLEATEGWLETAPSEDLLRTYPAERISAQPDSAEVRVGGRRVSVYANVNLPDDAVFAATLGADGVGLLRTEFLYTSGRIPSFEEEVAAYQRVAEAMHGRPIVVRTLDLGADKMPAELVRPEEDYGMLGIRGIRLLLRRPELFKQHARAVLTGFAGTDVRVMLPMIADPQEFVCAREILLDVSRTLAVELPPLGIMFEIPAVAFEFEAFARAGASFASIGTNDLAQYFFAADRLQGGANLAVGTPGGEGFRAFVAQAIAAARASGLTVSVCGEAAGDTAFTDLWLHSGVDGLSVAPGLVPWLKRRLRERKTT